MNEITTQPIAATPRAPVVSSPLDALVEPSRVFAHPRDVLAASDLSRAEKRAILASWASDAWAVESAPGLRHCPGLAGCQVPLDEVLDALRALDPTPDGVRERKPVSRRKGRVRWLTQRLPRIGEARLVARGVDHA